MSMHSDSGETVRAAAGAATGRFSNGKSAGSRTLPVRLDDRGVLIEGAGDDGSVLVWPYGALETAVPLSRSSSDVLITYKHMQGATLFLANAATLEQLRQRAPHLTTASQRRRWAMPLIIAACLVTLAAVGVSMANLTPARTIAGFIPEQTRVALGRQVIASMSAGHKHCTSPDGDAALASLLKRLTDAAGDPRFQVQVVDWGLLNAFAAPGAQIVVTRGLIAQAGGPDELAGVLAHEMGHGLKLHPESGMVRALGLSAALELMMGGSGGTLSNLGLMLAQLSYSRDAEREADSVAFDLVRKAKISAHGLADFFERVDGLQKGKGVKNSSASGSPNGKAKNPDDRSGSDRVGLPIPDLAIFSSHPMTSERLARARAIPGYAATPALSDSQWAALRKICGTKPIP